MLKKNVAGLLLTLAIAPGTLWAVDTVKLNSGARVGGKITTITQSEIYIESAGDKKELPVKDVDYVTFDGEPKELTQARNLIRQHKYTDARDTLEKVNDAALKRPEIAQDVEFYKALAAARLAIAGDGSKSDAGKRLLSFEKKNGQNYHYFEACELIGDLLVSLGRIEQADNFYERLAKAPWPEYKMKADVLVGRALQGKGDHDGAIKRFDAALADKTTGKEADGQRLVANLGKGSSLAAAGKNPEAIKLIEDVIAKADPENADLHARAYNVLGNCYIKVKNTDQALLAFLHVDLIYPGSPEQHAEALHRISGLWKEKERPDRAAEFAEKLQERYPNSRWALEGAR